MLDKLVHVFSSTQVRSSVLQRKGIAEIRVVPHTFWLFQPLLLVAPVFLKSVPLLAFSFLNYSFGELSGFDHKDSYKIRNTNNIT